MIKNIYFTYCLIPIIIAKIEIVQHEVHIVANIVPDIWPGCFYRSAAKKAVTIGENAEAGYRSGGIGSSFSAAVFYF